MICAVQVYLLTNLLTAACVVVDVAEGSDGDRADPEFLRILELHTTQLEKRVRACQSRIMLVTCFDVCV